MINDVKFKQFISFIIAGGLAAIVNFGSRFIYDDYMSFGNAVILAYMTGMMIAFTLSKFFVFKKSKHSVKREILYFSLVNIVAVIQTYIISVSSVNYIFPSINFTFHSESIAHAVGIIFPVFTSFIGHKYFSFKE
jgi:putative flippase GtrA